MIGRAGSLSGERDSGWKGNWGLHVAECGDFDPGSPLQLGLVWRLA